MDQKQGKTLDQTIVDVRQHVLYTGVTMTGKTTLARHHERILSRAKYPTVVYDPVMTATAGGGWSETAVIYNDQEKLMKFFDKARGTDEHPIFVFVDEGADLFDHGQTENHFIPRRIRHQGVYLRIIAQRPKMLHPNVRTQCAYAYVLRLASDDKKTILADMGHDTNIESKPLDMGDCMLVTSGSSEIEEFNVFELVDRKRKPSKDRT